MDGATGILLRALAFAAERHSGQRRKDAAASPYINHPIALADVLANEGRVFDVVVLSAAMLHDTIEDTATTADEIAARFGARIAREPSRETPAFISSTTPSSWAPPPPARTFVLPEHRRSPSSRSQHACMRP